jgi:LysM repeat protein/ABC-type branched-subunit amino acid transport system substrate-binding protein
MGIIPKKNAVKLIIIRLLIITIGCFFIPYFSIAQSADIKKSSKTVTIEGKKYYIHKIEKGQTVYSIATVYGVSKNDLILENPELINGTKEGQEIKIPVKKESVNSSTTSANGLTFKEHVVAPKQTLYAISKLYNISIEEIIKYNPEVENGLKAGQVLQIVQPATSSPVYQKPALPLTTNTSIEKQNINEPSKIETGMWLNHTADTVLIENNRTIKVALLLPFHLSMQKVFNDSAETSGEIYPKSIIALDFYQGFLIAADSICKLGFKVDLYVYDTGNDSLALAKILVKPELKTVDLIIGPIYSEQLIQVSAFSKQYKIPMVSVFSQNNKFLLGNPYAIKMVASPITQFNYIAKYVIKNKLNQTCYLITDESEKDKPQINTVKRIFKSSNDTIKLLSIKNGFTELEKVLSLRTPKIFIIPVTDQPKVTELITKIYLSKDTTITVFGADTWVNFSNLETERIAKINTIVPSYYYVDYSAKEVINFILKFKALQNVEPSRYAFQGYDTGIFFLNWLAQNKPDFSLKKSVHFVGLQNNFYFVKTAEDSGYENNYVHLLSFKNIIPIKIN